MGLTRFSNPLVERIAEFLREIGIRAKPGNVSPEATLPGIAIEHGALVIDEERLKWPGDILHEAGHLAVAAPERRAAMHQDVGKDGGEEMMAIAWSYAAALYIGIDPSLVFHEGGYKGGGSTLLEIFRGKVPFGVSTLEWIGLTYGEKTASMRGIAPYPHMLRWLREESV